MFRLASLAPNSIQWVVPPRDPLRPAETCNVTLNNPVGRAAQVGEALELRNVATAPQIGSLGLLGR